MWSKINNWIDKDFTIGLIFLGLATHAWLFGFDGITATSAGIAKLVFYTFIVFF
jgi:uncharacterized membrane protein YtjA (UPF0391 family)